LELKLISGGASAIILFGMFLMTKDYTAGRTLSSEYPLCCEFILSNYPQDF